MKLVLAAESLDPKFGGPSYVIARIGELLQARGVQVSYGVPKLGGYALPGPRARLPSFGGVDVVHTFGVWTAYNHLVSRTAHVVGRPLVLCPMGMLEPWALAKGRFKKRAAWRLWLEGDLKRATVVQATAASEAEQLRSLRGSGPIAILPHGVDVPQELPERSPPPPTRTALFLSRYDPKKGLLELIEAWAALRPQAWRLLVVGPDPAGYRAVIERAVVAAGLESSVRLRGPVWGADKTRTFAEADLFVLPTHSENFGVVVPEALGHGVPAITTTAAPWGELEETRSGYWIEPGVEPLVEALRRALAEPPEVLRAMGDRGRALVLARYGWQPVIAAHEALYAWLLGAGPRPAFVVD